MKRFTIIVFFILSVFIFNLSLSQEKSGTYKYKDDPLRYEEDIQKFEEMDKVYFPSPGVIVFAGSSSIKRWVTLKEDFIPFNVINRGFGGSQTSDLIYYAGRVIIPYKPSMVVVYEGDNDIAVGKTPEMVYNDFKKLVKKIHEKLPQTVIFYITIKPSIMRWDMWEKMDKANRLIKIFSMNNPLVEHIDIGVSMLSRDGKPRPELFVEDGLHVNEKGYKLWTSIVKPYIIKQVMKGNN